MVKIGTAKIGTAKIGTAKIGTAKIGVGKISMEKISTAKISTAKISTAKIGTAKIGTAKIGTAKIGVGKISMEKISTAKIGTAKIDTVKISTAKIGTAKIGIFSDLKFSNQFSGISVEYFCQWIFYCMFCGDLFRVKIWMKKANAVNRTFTLILTSVFSQDIDDVFFIMSLNYHFWYANVLLVANYESVSNLH